MTSDSDEATFRAYRDALFEALAGSSVMADAAPLVMLSRVVRDARDASDAEPVEALGVVSAAPSLDAAVREAIARFESGIAFREAVYYARCLGRDPGPVLRLAAFRRYAEGAVVSYDLPDLATDRAAVLDATTFEGAWRDAGRIGWMLETLHLWRRDFIFVYHARHASHASLVKGVVEAVAAMLPAAEAVARLNRLDGLGAPLGVEAIAGVLDLAPFEACEIDAELLAEALESRPSCPGCEYVLGQQTPSAEVQRLRGAIDKALAGQQTRLAQRVVSKLLLQPVNGGGERLERFVQVVQASDLTGLALVLDDSLIEFLLNVVDAPNDSTSVLERLAVAYPEVTTANLDAAVGELRRLLEDGVSSDGVVRLRPSSASGS